MKIRNPKPKTQFLSILFLAFSFLFGCDTKSGIENKFQKKIKIPLTDLFYSVNDNNSLTPRNLENVDIIRGFRRAKLGIKLDTLNFVDWEVDSSKYQYGLLILTKKNLYDTMKIGRDQVSNIEISFYNGTLMEISMKIYEATSYMTGDLGIIEVLVNVYGDPTWTKPIHKGDFISYINNWKAPLVGTITELQKWESSSTRIITRSIVQFDNSSESYYHKGEFITPTYLDF